MDVPVHILPVLKPESMVGDEFFVVRTFSNDDIGDSKSERCLNVGLNRYPLFLEQFHYLPPHLLPKH
jgi:hypothetical protein